VSDNGTERGDSPYSARVENICSSASAELVFFDSPVDAEKWGSRATSLWWETDPEDVDRRAEILRLFQQTVDYCDAHRSSLGLSILAAFSAAGAPSLRQQAASALDRLREEGITGPSWVRFVGRAQFEDAWRIHDDRYDQPGQECLFIGYSYDGIASHSLRVVLDKNQGGVLRDADIGPSLTEMATRWRDGRPDMPASIERLSPDTAMSLVAEAWQRTWRVSQVSFLPSFLETASILDARVESWRFGPGRHRGHLRLLLPLSSEKLASSSAPFASDDGADGHRSCHPSTVEAPVPDGTVLRLVPSHFREVADEVAPDEKEDLKVQAILLAMKEEDPVLADRAKWAYNALTWGEGVQAISQHGLQTWLWSELPGMWARDAHDHYSLATALGELFARLGRDRKAALCASSLTEKILAAYANNPKKGAAQCRRAMRASGVEPPDLEDFVWGRSMGPVESEAFFSTATALEQAIVSGTLRPGAPAWRARQGRLVFCHLRAGRPALNGGNWLHEMLRERRAVWGHSRGYTRPRLIERVENCIPFDAVSLPDNAADSLCLLRWFAARSADGLDIAADGALVPSLLSSLSREAAASCATSLGLPATEKAFLSPLLAIAELSLGLRLVRRRHGQLVAVKGALPLLADTAQLWRAVTRFFARGTDLNAAVRELVFALLLLGNTQSLSQNMVTVLREEGWGSEEHTEGFDLPAVGRSVTGLLHMMTSLGMIQPAPRGLDDTCLTEMGWATVLETLRCRSSAPLPSFLP